MSHINHAPNHYSDDTWSRQFISVNNFLVNNGNHPLMQNGGPVREMAYDPVNGVIHEGMNGVLLDNVSALKGYKDPRWIRSYDLEDMGYDVKYGERPVAVAYHNRYNEPAKGLNKRNGENRYYFVYNAEQVRNFPSLEKTRTKEKHQALQAQKELKIDRARTNTPEELTVSDQLKDMVVKSSAAGKELAYAYAVYRHCQEVGLKYRPPIDTELIKTQLLAPSANVMKSVYFGNMQAVRLSNHDLSHTTGESRAYTIDRNRIEMKNPAVEQTTGFER